MSVSYLSFAVCKDEAGQLTFLKLKIRGELVRNALLYLLKRKVVENCSFCTLLG
jgi:hypothetical protein